MKVVSLTYTDHGLYKHQKYCLARHFLQRRGITISSLSSTFCLRHALIIAIAIFGTNTIVHPTSVPSPLTKPLVSSLYSCSSWSVLGGNGNRNILSLYHGSHGTKMLEQQKHHTHHKRHLRYRYASTAFTTLHYRSQRCIRNTCNIEHDRDDEHARSQRNSDQFPVTITMTKGPNEPIRSGRGLQFLQTYGVDACVGRGRGKFGRIRKTGRNSALHESFDARRLGNENPNHIVKVEDAAGVKDWPGVLPPNSRRDFVKSSLLWGCAFSTSMLLFRKDSTSARAFSFNAATSSQPWTSSSPSILTNTLPQSHTTASANTTSTASKEVDYRSIISKASKRALGGGKAGATAAVVQVCSLMWLRTAMNYQYRYGGSLPEALSTLWKAGGIPRLYQGLPFAIVQGPLSRFGDTAANVGMLALLESIETTASLPLPLRTAFGSLAAGCWRIFLMPIDTSKIAMQVEGQDGLSRLWTSVLPSAEDAGVNIRPLYQGALASAAATAVGHYPWFLTYNALNDYLPFVERTDDLLLFLVRSAFLGLAASCVSDCCSNSLRVIKTTKQTAGLRNKEDEIEAVKFEVEGKVHDDASDTALLSADVHVEEKVLTTGENGIESKLLPTSKNVSTIRDEISTNKAKTSTTNKEITYQEALSMVIEKDGIAGLLGRGLQTRILTNAIQGAAFSVLWKYFQSVGIGGG